MDDQGAQDNSLQGDPGPGNIEGVQEQVEERQQDQGETINLDAIQRRLLNQQEQHRDEQYFNSPNSLAMMIARGDIQRNQQTPQPDLGQVLGQPQNAPQNREHLLRLLDQVVALPVDPNDVPDDETKRANDGD